MTESEKERLQKRLQRENKAHLIQAIIEQSTRIDELRTNNQSLDKKIGHWEERDQHQQSLVEAQQREINKLRKETLQLISDIRNLKKGAEILAKDYTKQEQEMYGKIHYPYLEMQPSQNDKAI